jgi:hypothetical protein
MPDVPHDLVAGCIERAVEADGELDDAEVRREVPAGDRDRVDDGVADLRCELRQLRGGQGLHVRRRCDGIKDPFRVQVR